MEVMLLHVSCWTEEMSWDLALPWRGACPATMELGLEVGHSVTRQSLSNLAAFC